MKHAILIIGEDLRINRPFLRYIIERYEEKFCEPGDLKFINKNDKNLPFHIENLTQDYDYLSIFASNESYHIVSKILATLTSDLLELKNDETLAPSNVKKVVKNSFLMMLNGCAINLLKANPLEELPTILIAPNDNFKTFYLFDYDASSVKILLEPLTTTYEIQISITKYSEHLTLVKAEEKHFGELDEFIKSVSNLFSGRVILEKEISEFIVKKLHKIGAKITFAESCTAGLIASKIGSVSGASNILDGALVTYSNEIKNIWLNVDNEVLQNNGAVSKECVEQMLNGALENSGANFALAVSGIAGPGGGSVKKPVGTVFIGAAQNGGKIVVNEYHISGNRNAIKEESANIALSLLLKLRSDLFFSPYTSHQAQN